MEKRLFADGTDPGHAFRVTESTVTSKGVCIIVNYERIRKQTGAWELGLIAQFLTNAELLMGGLNTKHEPTLH